MAGQVRVVVAGREWVSDGTPIAFGRSRECDICLDPEDTGISRRAGSVEFEHGTWWVRNCSDARPLSIVDDLGFRSVLAPGRRAAVETPVRVLVDCSQNRPHSLLIEPLDVAAERDPKPAEHDSGDSTAIGQGVFISEADRLAMIALFAGYLEDPPRYDPHPKSYAAAAARLGWPRSTLVKRIEYLRSRLDGAGVPNMTGWTALTNLAEYAISRRLITKEDLALLR
ncbi:FHA domain-containing protein [Allorhizocola rhizosphaerae]|uniref:FHA domain-containing protein n=1 Tax=Allorhizocola rhizosphaerae TaxID=1872709 RepID=UPI000E3BC5C4|nr:FHA domain-containing protein [Allorhizocola rhizosphaerae]